VSAPLAAAFHGARGLARRIKARAARAKVIAAGLGGVVRIRTAKVLVLPTFVMHGRM